MKKRILSILLSAVFLICMCTTQIIASADVSSNYSSVSTLECQKYPIKNSTIVTFGDSITAFAGWQDEIEALGATVVNSGVGGRSVLASMQEFGSCVLQYNPDFATIMFGFNDGNKGKSTGNGTEAVSKEKFKAYYKEFVRLCRENDIIPIIITQHTCVEDIWYSDSRYPDTESFYEEAGGVAAWFDSYAQIARDVANELDVNLIDWNAYSKTFDETDIINSDGVHLSSNGQNALGELVSDYFSTNFSGDAAETEKPVYPKQNTVLIEDFNDSTAVPENFSSNGKAESTLTVTDEISTGNNTLKNEGAEWSGPRFSFNSMPENCIGLRFKMYTSAPTYSVWAFNSTSAYDTANRVYDERYITNYVYDAFVAYNFYFDDYTVDTGSISDIVSFTIIPVSGKTAYFDDFEWIVEGTNTNPATTTTKATETSLQSTTVTTTTTTTTTASNSTEDSGVINLTTGTVYDKLTTAISAATSGDTLKLLSGLSVDATSSGISISKSLVIDLGGNTLTSTNKRLFNITASSNAELTIKNGNLVIDSSSSDIPIAVRATNDLVLEDLTVTGSSTPNYGFVTILSPSTTDPCNITAKNCNINTSGYIFSDNNASNAAWNLYIYNSELSVSSGSIILKKDTAKTYDTIIYSGHIKNGSLNTAHYPNLKIADGSYMTATEGGSKDTAITSFTTEYWVYVDPNVDCSMVSGASIRLGDINGIRFYTKVDTAKIATLRSAGYTVELGTLIAPADNIQDTELNFNLEAGKYVDVKFNSTTYYTEGEFTGIVGSLAKIKDENIAKDFVGRGYVKVTKVNDVTITYADYAKGADEVSSVANNTRSLAYVANAYKTDGNSGYGSLDQEVKDLIDNWASKLQNA